MVQVLPQSGSLFGRIGAGIGQGLSEQLPKEMERGRLAQGLQQFEQDSAGLNPMQSLARAYAIPGITPQMAQSIGDLARQQARGNSLRDIESQKNFSKPSPFTQEPPKPSSPGSEIPSLTEEESFAKSQQGHIPRTEEQKLIDAGKKYNNNPALFGNDPQKAIDYENQVDKTNQEIANAHQTKHQNLTAIQDNLVKRLKDYSDRLGVKIPANVYSKIEDKAIESTKPIDKGGEGLTEQQAMKNYGKELDKVSRDYSAIDAIGNWSITGRRPSDTIQNIQSLQKKFDERDDTENFADSLIAVNGFSPLYAYSKAEPVSGQKQLKVELDKIPKIDKKVNFKKGYPELAVPEEYTKDETLKIAKKLGPLLSKKGSPLAVGHELEKKGYDPLIWMDYLDDNRRELKLTEAQGRQLDKPRNYIPTWNDWWLQTWGGE